MRAVISRHPRLAIGTAVALAVALVSLFIFPGRYEPVQRGYSSVIVRELASQPPAISRYYLPALGQYRPQSKIGLAWSATNCGDQVALNLAGGNRYGWYFRWGASPNGCQPAPEFIPMWRPGQTWPYPPDYRGYCLVFNEPDRPDQDNLTVDQATSLWIYFRSFAPNCRAVVLNLARGDNTAYANSWREAIKALPGGSYPVVTGWGIHTYGTRSQIEAQVLAFRNWMVAKGLTADQLWLSETGGAYAVHMPQLSTADLSYLLDKFETWTWLHRYAFFPPRWYKPGDCSTNCVDSLFVGNSSTLTPLGQEFRAGGYPGPSQPVIQPIPSQESYP